jgi:pimeloyl-ACP methyl ester carboxylesterase
MLLTGDDYGLAKALQRSIASVPADVIAARVRATLTVDVSAALGRLRQPLLYLRATKDRVVSAACAERFCTEQPRTQLVELPGPHLLLQSLPALAWQHIARL